MRKLVYLLPAVLITACSVIDQPYLPSGEYNSVQQGQYAQQGQYQGQYGGGCTSGACAPGQSYSVANNRNANGAYGGQNGQGYNQGYGAPTHVNPTGYGHQTGYGAPFGAPFGASGLRGLGQRAKGNFYSTLGGVWYDTGLDSFGVEGRIGYDSGRIIGAEVEASIGVSDESDRFDVQGQRVNTEAGFDYNLAAFALARLPISKQFSLHGRVGYDVRSLEITAEAAASNESASENFDLDGFAYGIGGEYSFSPRDALRLDYTIYDNDIGESDSLSASYVRKF